VAGWIDREQCRTSDRQPPRFHPLITTTGFLNAEIVNDCVLSKSSGRKQPPFLKRAGPAEITDPG
jgi:hypothetical protein